MRTLSLTIAIILCLSVGAHAQTSTFTYQGRLTESTAPASGTYEMQFSLWTAVSGGLQLGTTITNNAVVVTGGVFTVNLDFGGINFGTGLDRFLEISIHKPSDPPGFTILTPRHRITSSPYSIRSSFAGNADTFDNLTSSQFLRSDSADTMQGTLNMSNNPIQNIGSAGTDFSPTGGLRLADALTLSNDETIDNSVDGTITFGRNTAGTVTLTAKDTDANADLVIRPGGAGSMTINPVGLLAIQASTINVLTTTLGNAGINLPSESIGANEIAGDSISGSHLADTIILDASTAVATDHDKTFSVVSALTGGNRTAAAFSVSQPNSATNSLTAPLVSISQNDTSSTGPALQITQSGSGSAVDILGGTLSGTTATINFSNFDVSSSGSISANGLTLGVNGTVISSSVRVIVGIAGGSIPAGSCTDNLGLAPPGSLTLGAEVAVGARHQRLLPD